MTDNEIIKALEICTSEGTTCDDCPYFCDGCLEAEYRSKPMRDALALITRQKAEIERLQKENKEQKLILEAINDEMNPLPFETDFDKAIKQAKSEAYREFAKEFVGDLSHMITYDKDYIKAKIFNLVETKQKELTEK